MSDISFLIDPSHLTGRTLFVCSFPAESTLYVWRDKGEAVGVKKKKKTAAAKQDVLPRTPPVASAGLCVASLFSTNMPAG